MNSCLCNHLQWLFPFWKHPPYHQVNTKLWQTLRSWVRLSSTAPRMPLHQDLKPPDSRAYKPICGVQQSISRTPALRSTCSAARSPRFVGTLLAQRLALTSQRAYKASAALSVGFPRTQGVPPYWAKPSPRLGCPLGPTLFTDRASQPRP